MKKSTLACIAPACFQKKLRNGLQAVGIQIQFHLRKNRQGVSLDPYGVVDLSLQIDGQIDGILVVAERSRGPRNVVPGAIINGYPVGVVFANRIIDLEPWLSALSNTSGLPTWAVLAMWKKSYLSMGNRFVKWLRTTSEFPVERWFADRVEREELCERLALGPRLAVYLGHGRSTGLCGYLGLRWKHILQYKKFIPCGTIISFACDTLKKKNGRIPFGCKWIREGRAATYFGSVDAVSSDANAKLAYALGRAFESNKPSSLAALMKCMMNELKDTQSNEAALHALKTYRIIGNPLQSFYIHKIEEIKCV